MLFFDCLYGPITIRSPLFRDLAHTPEFFRLRNVRMMNVDTPLCKDLATASRFAHTIGVCHLAEWLGHSRELSIAHQNAVIAAAVLHDMGIPPFGHLIEQMFDEIDPPFDHESIARQIVEGTYAPENKYHQIYAGRTLQVGAVLDKHGVDRDIVFQLLEPRRFATLIVGAIDLDNIDNVLRMATLLGLGSYRDLAYRLASGLQVAHGGRVRLSGDIASAAFDWLRLRARCYEIMMYPRSGIAYAALVHDLAESAVRSGVIKKDEWYLTDDKLMRRLLDNETTAPLAAQLESGVQYVALTAVRVFFDSAHGPVLRGERRREFLRTLAAQADTTSLGLSPFAWYEYAKISRSIDFEGGHGPSVIGEPSSTAVVALIRTAEVRRGDKNSTAHIIKHWVTLVHQTAEHFAPVVRIAPLPDSRHFSSDPFDDGTQLSIFDEA